MLQTYWYLPIVALGLALAVMGPYGVPLLVLGVTLGIFFGTVTLRSPRSRDAGSTHPGV